MSLDPDRISRIVAILDQPELQDFEALVRLSGLDPARAFRRADLTGVDFGRADLSGYDVSGADLSGANLSLARGLARIKYDKATKWPGGWHPPPPDLDLDAGLLERAIRRITTVWRDMAASAAGETDETLDAQMQACLNGRGGDTGLKLRWDPPELKKSVARRILRRLLRRA